MIETVMLIVHIAISLAIPLRVLTIIKAKQHENVWMRILAGTFFLASGSTAIRIMTG